MEDHLLKTKAHLSKLSKKQYNPTEIMMCSQKHEWFVLTTVCFVLTAKKAMQVFIIYA